MTHTVPSICRNCLAYCPILVTVEDGRVIKVMGDREAILYEGYTCPKGRALPAQHNDQKRLLRCLKREPDGSFSEIRSDGVIPEIARKVEDIIRKFGPRAIAMYIGTGNVSHPPAPMVAGAWLRAIGSPMMFSAATIDKPAANTSTALHGNWMAGAQAFGSSDTWMIIGANPVIAKSNGTPANNPGQRLKEAVNRGMKLIVIDPRRTETAKRAHLHVQARPGEDPTILATIIRIIIEEKLYDRQFIAENTLGFDALKAAVDRYTPEYAAQRADVAPETLFEAARTFGNAKRGGVVCSTGPSFSTHSNLTYYLALCLNTLCGRWARAGEKASYPNALLPAFTPKAQPYPPYPVFGETLLRVHGLRENASGLPTAALADEILLDGDGQIKALFCLGGNPLTSWPDQIKTEAALKKLDLLVVFDYKMTATAKYADYIVPPPLSLEVPGSTNFVESLKYFGVSRGFEVPWAQYTAKVVDRPRDSDLLDESEFFFGLAQQMALQLDWVNTRGFGPHRESATESIPFDMRHMPDTDDLIELMCRNSRIPLAEVKNHPHGHVFDAPDLYVAPRDPNCSTRLQLGDPMMMEELYAIRDEETENTGVSLFPYRLVCRRANTFMNSVGQDVPALNGGKNFNPVFMHPADIQRIGVDEGAWIKIRSSHGEILAAVEADDALRQGVVSIYHGFGAAPFDENQDPRAVGAAIARLINMDEFDPITGIPRMSAIAVALEPVDLAAKGFTATSLQ